jgi:Rps23 Pro-64 3,4-dihydroxylase Tpa1-like proline 4-hydroxylase
MKIFPDGISLSLCKEIYDWAETYIYGKPNHPLGFPNPVKTMTNLAWQDSIIKDSKPVIIYTLPNEIIKKIKEELIKLKLIGGLDENVGAMVYVWTPGSYIPLHQDGFADKHRKVFTVYLNEHWSIQDGGTFNYLDKNDRQWKMLVPKQGLLVYNDNNEGHYTTVSNEGRIRISLQMFAQPNN